MKWYCLLLVVFMFACSPISPLGKAGSVLSGAASPDNVLDVRPLLVSSSLNYFNISAHNLHFVWKTGYYYDGTTLTPFNFNEDAYPNTNWVVIYGSDISSLNKSITLSSRASPQYVFVYGCNWLPDAGNFDCNNDGQPGGAQWIAQVVNVNPICTNTCVINSKQCSGAINQTCVSDGAGCSVWIGNSACTYGCNVTTGFCNPASIPCVDSDGGLNYYQKGNASLGIGDFVDHCLDTFDPVDNTLIENYCTSFGISSTSYECPYGCSQGVCNAAPFFQVTSPIANNSYYNNSIISINLSSSHVLSYCKISFNSAVNYYFGLALNASNTGVKTSLPSWNDYVGSSGKYNATFWCVDTSNILSALRVPVTVVSATAQSAPGIRVVSPAAGSTFTSAQWINFSLSSDKVLSSCNIIGSGIAMNLNASKTGASVSVSMSPGSYNRFFWCNDTNNKINNSMNVSFNVVEPIRPIVTITSPLISSFNVNTSVNFSVSSDRLIYVCFISFDNGTNYSTMTSTAGSFAATYSKTFTANGTYPVQIFCKDTSYVNSDNKNMVVTINPAPVVVVPTTCAKQGGTNVNTIGTLTISQGSTVVNQYSDYCVDDNNVREYFCAGNQMSFVDMTCDYGCVSPDGVCESLPGGPGAPGSV